jgi:WD40 repeat protein
VTRALTLSALIVLAASAVIGADKPVATLQLPCESRYQDLSPAGNQLAVHCKGGGLRLLEVPSGTEQRAFPPDHHANSIVYSHDGDWLAFGFDDGTVEVLPARGTGASKRWKPSSRRIDALNFFPDSNSIVIGPVDSPAQVWAITDAPALRATLPFTFGGLSDSAISPDGKVMVLAGDDTVLRWYDTGTWTPINENRDFLLETFAVTFTADGKQVLAGGADSRISVLDAATGKVLRQTVPEAGAFIVGLEVLGDQPRVAALYFDDAGEKPPHGLMWDLANFKSAPMGNGRVPTCGAKVTGKLWVCNTQGKTLTITAYD